MYTSSRMCDARMQKLFQWFEAHSEMLHMAYALIDCVKCLAAASLIFRETLLLHDSLFRFSAASFRRRAF